MYTEKPGASRHAVSGKLINRTLLKILRQSNVVFKEKIIP
jgi:hypothetical protein